MTPDELLKKLESMGIIVSRRTLLRYEQNKLIPEPKRGSEGRGVGRFTDYHANTPYEFFASWHLLKKHKESIEHVAEIRDYALNKDVRDICNAIVLDVNKSYLMSALDWKDYVEHSQNTIIERMDKVDEQMARTRKYIANLLEEYRNTKKILEETKLLLRLSQLQNVELKDQLKKLQDPVK